jgi:hypothetical protein
MPAKPSRLNYYRRIFSAYLGNSKSQLTFWHETPELNADFLPGTMGAYYLTFAQKADYSDALDETGIPLLDYRGVLGRQYNPIAIAQYGLGNYNLYASTGDPSRKAKFLNVADWLVSSLRQNQAGLWVWMHDFDWEYRETLRAPWYSGLAQGQGISLLLRAHQETGESKYMENSRRAFESFEVSVRSGGVLCTDANGDRWFEEYIVFPETHILNGFIWASWGVYDYWLATRNQAALDLFRAAVDTLRRRLVSFDLGYWSLYEHSGTRLPMIASRFYHSLHIVQLRVMQKITGQSFFGEVADRWEGYQRKRLNRMRSFAWKVLFKLNHY